MSGFYLYNSVCMDQCPIGFFKNTSSQMCQSCSDTCLTCDLVASNCTSCQTGYLQ